MDFFLNWLQNFWHRQTIFIINPLISLLEEGIKREKFFDYYFETEIILIFSCNVNKFNYPLKITEPP